MKKAAVYGQSYAISSEKEIKTLLQVLEKNKIDFFIESKFYTLLVESNILQNNYKSFASFNDLDSSFDIMFTIGGDGTFLRSATHIRDLNIPILGINTGRLGFLAIVAKDLIEESVELVINGDFTIQERTLISVKTEPKTKDFSELNFALNEVTIAKKNTTSMIGVKTSLNEEYHTN